MKIHYHSDCPFFAGCERMLINLFASEDLKSRHHISFSYRYASDYESGLKKQLQTPIRLIPLRLFDFRFSSLPAKLLAHLLFLKLWRFMWNVLALYRAFGNSIDLLHINSGGYPGPLSCRAAVFAARLRGIRKIIFVVNNIAVSYRSPNRWLDYPIDRLVARWVTRFVTASQLATSELSKVLRLPASKVITIPNAVVPRNVTETKEETFKRLGLSRNGPLFAVVSLLEKRKGHLFLLKAFKQLATPLTLLIEGTGPERKNLQNFAQQEGLHNVWFIGSEQHIDNLLNVVDVLLETSIADSPTPNVVSEAMSLGKTIIASRWSSAEQIDHQKNGLLCDPKNTEELAKAIYEVLSDASLRERLSQNALETYKQKFTASKAVEKYCQLYGELLATH